ncbi:MAG: class I SAM-dependent methyltransferase [Candidatus Saganbacteria bacterium]|nr:class I SAM-dependent methyltransferase [Candidatus Saganbacteria bacterium]
MKQGKSFKKEVWGKAHTVMGDKQLCLGKHWSYNLYNDPKRLAFVLARYKFVAKMASKGKKIIEFGCSEGIGVPIMSEFAARYTGVDMDGDAILTARENWGSEKVRFINDDFLGKKYGSFDAAVSLDVIEHIVPKKENEFFKTLYNNVSADGMAIVGTPNQTSFAYASKASRLGHVNLFTYDRLKAVMQRYFKMVFVFGMNDEIVHTGFLPMAHYLLCVGCGKEKKQKK